MGQEPFQDDMKGGLQARAVVLLITRLVSVHAYCACCLSTAPFADMLCFLRPRRFADKEAVRMSSSNA